MNSILYRIVILILLQHSFCLGMEQGQLAVSYKKKTARKMLASPYREAYADVLQQHSIAPKNSIPKPKDTLVARCAEMLKNETLELLEKLCIDAHSPIPICLASSLIEDRLNDEIVSHLDTLGSLTEERQKLHSSLDAAQNLAEKSELESQLKTINKKIGTANVQANIAQHALSVRNTALFLQKEHASSNH